MRALLTVPLFIACTHTLKPAPSAGLYFRSSQPISMAAIRRADEVVGQMLSRSPMLLKKMKEEPYALNVLGLNQKLTEFPGFEDWKFAVTDDGREYPELRGLAWRTDSIVSEENLLCMDQDVTKENVLVHEFAHSLHFYLDNPTFLEIQEAYENAKRKKLYPESSYMLKNEWEYFAVGSSIYFGSTYRWDIVGEIRNRIDLEDGDPALAKVLDRVYAGAEISPAPGCLY